MSSEMPLGVAAFKGILSFGVDLHIDFFITLEANTLLLGLECLDPDLFIYLVKILEKVILELTGFWRLITLVTLK